MTQLVGRILRLPDATPTRVESLDQSYVICHRATTRDVVSAIKTALEEEGMADLARSVVTSDDANGPSARKLRRREPFANREIFLPVVNWVAGDDVRPLDYEQDILAGIDWSEVDLIPLLERLPGPGAVTTRSQLTQIRFTGTSGDDFISTSPVPRIDDAPRFDPVYATRVLADVVSNPWQARAIVGDFVGMLAERGFNDRSLAEMSSLLIEELRRFLIAESDARAEAIFVRFVESGQVQFRLRTDRHNWRMPGELETQLPESSRQLVRSDGRPAEKSIFAPVYEDDFNSDEAEFACYLDEASAVQWWHRNVARSGQYSVQGWRRHRVYPDFIFAIEPNRDRHRVLVIETKGDQLEGNLDTIYKRKLLTLMTEHFRAENVTIAGELQLVVDRDTTVKCDLILMSEWKTRLPTEIQGYEKLELRSRRVAEP